MIRKSNEETLGEVIKRMVQAYRIEPGLLQAKIVSLWDIKLGPLVAKRTESIRFHNGNIYVKLNSSPLKNELKMEQTKVLALLNEGFPEPVVHEIIFV